MQNESSALNFERELDELRTAYLHALPDKARLVHKAWYSIDFTDWDQQAYKSVYRLIHNLAGGAGTYGFASISMQARRVLDTMKPWMEADEPPGSETQLEINQAIEMLEQTTSSTVKAADQQTHHLRKPPIRHVVVDQATVSEIFLVEDDPEQATFLRLVLEQAGHRVQVFNNLDETRVALQALEPTAILMDMVFPEGELAGANTVAEIQQDRTIPIPIFFISTRTDLEARLSAVRAGAWHYFSKPVDVKKLVRRLDDYIKPGKSAPKNILVVDDDSAISSLFAAHLEKEGNLQTIQLNEPYRLLEAMEEIMPDLVLMDYHMPGCNGLELAAVIRQHESFSNVPIIFLTEETNIETQLTAMNIGSDAFFTKSMGPDRLVLAVQSQLERLDNLKTAERPTAWNMN